MDGMNAKKIGAMIASLRKERKLTQQELADLLGVTNKAVSKWERGDGCPDISLMTALADALGVTADELLRGERRSPSEDGNVAAASDVASGEPGEETESAEDMGETRLFSPGAFSSGEKTEIDESEEDEPEAPSIFRRWIVLAAVVAVLAVAVLTLWLLIPRGGVNNVSSVSTSRAEHTTSTQKTTTTRLTTETTKTITTAARTTTVAPTSPPTVAPTSPPTAPPIVIPTNPPKPKLPGTDVIPQANYALLYDATHDRVLYSVQSDARCYPASITKLLTAIVALEYPGADVVYTVGDELSLVHEDSSVAYLKQGQRLRRGTLLNAMLLESGNDAAYVLAVRIGRMAAGNESLSASEAVAQFCRLMNETAQRIGATGSHFTNPDGFHDSGHYTTAMDVLTIARYAYSLPEIKKAAGRLTARDVFESGEDVTWRNTNRLLSSSDPYYRSFATGLKTGYTAEAGDCVVATAEKDGVTLFAVVMDAPSDDARWRDATAMLDAGFASLQ